VARFPKLEWPGDMPRIATLDRSGYDPHRRSTGYRTSRRFGTGPAGAPAAPRPVAGCAGRAVLRNR
jgi:hypothetical protein